MTTVNLRKIFLTSEALIFAVGQIVAGALNYLFQIYAARVMPELDFGSWSRWLAQFSVTCFFGVWLQSVAVISDTESIFSFKKCKILAFILSAALILTLFLSWREGAFVAGWGLALLSGFLFGSNLRKKNMRLLALASVITPVARFGWIFFDKSPSAFYAATLTAPLFSCLVFLSFTKQSISNGVDSNRKPTKSLLLAALSLAFFSTWTPQVDLLMISRILTPTLFGSFAKVALLSKGFFFGFQILAQMLLAHQVQTSDNRLGTKPLIFLTSLGLGAALVGAGAAQLLEWPIGWAFLSLLHITTLCLMYIFVQEFAASQKGVATLILCVISVLLTFLSSELASPEIYWAVTIVVETLVVLICLYRFSRSRHFDTIE